MKKSILDKFSGITDEIVIDEEYISDYYPEHNHKQNAMLMDVARLAWDSHLGVCVTCPTRCLSEKYSKTRLFDEEQE
jgi:hypothetical protein